MSKCKLFLWKLQQNSLVTSDNLYRWRLGDSASCPICIDDVESCQHPFRECPLALEAYSITNLLHPVIDNAHLTFTEWILLYIIRFTDTEGVHSSHLSAYVGTLWAIQTTRNNQVFRNIRTTKKVFHQHIEMVSNNIWCFPTKFCGLVSLQWTAIQPLVSSLSTQVVISKQHLRLLFIQMVRGFNIHNMRLLHEQLGFRG